MRISDWSSDVCSSDLLGEGVDDGDDRLAEILVLHTGGTPQAARAGHVAAMSRGSGTVCRHGAFLRGTERPPDCSGGRRLSPDQPEISCCGPCRQACSSRYTESWRAAWRRHPRADAGPDWSG